MVFNMTEAEWDAVLRVHLYGSFNMVRQCVPHMIEQRYGRIALFSSVSGLGSAGQTNYTSAKEGIVGFARSLAKELAPWGISVNAIYPGANTRMMATVPDSVRHGSGGGAAEIVGSLEPEEALAPENNAAKIVHLCTEAGGAFTRPGRRDERLGDVPVFHAPRIQEHPHRWRVDAWTSWSGSFPHPSPPASSIRPRRSRRVKSGRDAGTVVDRSPLRPT